MKYLLDTHTFIWFDHEPQKLSSRVNTLLGDRANIILLSLVSIWEIQIKLQIGKLTLSTPLTTIIENQLDANQIEILPVTMQHIYGLEQLPLHHRDPFDRLLIAQSLIEQIPIIGQDASFALYPSKVIW